jgi:hypothetical protein
MAFLIGSDVPQRREIIKTITEIYKVRAAFVHHGQAPGHQEVLDHFLKIAWKTFARLLEQRDLYKSKAGLIGALEDRKLS